MSLSPFASARQGPLISAAAQTCLVLALVSCGWMGAGGSADVRAQRTEAPCADTLSTAEKAYRNQNNQEAIALASQCTDQRIVGDSTAIRAHRLVALASLRQGDLVQARTAIISILGIDPTYTADPVNDPPSYDLFVSQVREEVAPESPEEEADRGAPEPSAPPPDRTVAPFFVKPVGIGLSDYTGDYPAQNVGHPFDFQELRRGSGIPIVFTLELGYRLSPGWAVVLGMQGGNYPIVGYGGTNNTSDSDRFTPQLMIRYTFRDPDQTVRPYIDGGGNVTFGGEPVVGTGYGPSLGGGVSIALGRAVSMYVESRFNATFPDDAIDNAEFSGEGVGGPLDSVNQLLGVGLRINFGV